MIILINKMKNQNTTNSLIKRFRIIHGDRYDYSKFIYNKGSQEKYEIICKIHGSFTQTIFQHLKGQNCKRCMYEGERKVVNKLTKEQFINKSNIVHKNKFDYSLIDYKNNKTKVKIICPIHGVYLQRPDKHLLGEGCLRCSGKQQFTTKDFIEKSIIVHGNKYDYSLTKYKNNDSKVIIICPVHGKFNQMAKSHLKGCGCWFCGDSKGEKQIQKILDENNVLYTRQQTFQNCVNPKTGSKLKFDFYIPKYNLCIEYDGQQHFFPVQFKNMNPNKVNDIFKSTKQKDKIKNRYCKNNNIKLLRIPYTYFDKIEHLLKLNLIF